LKAASDGGNDIPFEQAFSNLAHAYTRDLAPSLLDHEIGFQLLDRKDDNTKAVGVTAFKVGSLMLYAPVFFLNGELKGRELLWLKNQDQFVPLKEEWLNYLINRKPLSIGSGVDRNLSRLGVLSPALSQLTRPPTKFGAAKALKSAIDAFIPDVAHFVVNDPVSDPKYVGIKSFPDFLKEAGLDMIQQTLDECRRNPSVGRYIEDFYGWDAVDAAIKTAGENLRRLSRRSLFDETPPEKAPLQPHIGSVLDDVCEHPIKTGALKVVAYDTTQGDLPKEITQSDREKLLRDAYLIVDHRKGEQVSIPFNVKVEQKLFNPTETGLYEVLVKPGSFERCFVAYYPMGPNGHMHFVTVARVGDEANWLNCHASRVWCASRIEGKEYDDWYDGLSTPSSLSKGYSRYILIGPRGDTTTPFRVEESLGADLGEHVYEVDFASYCDHNYAESLLSPRDRPYSDRDDSYSAYRDGQRIHLNGKPGTALRANRGDVYVPEGFKLLKVRRDRYDEEKTDGKLYACSPCCSSSGGSDSPPIRPGDLVDAHLMMMQKTAELTIYNDGIDVEINTQRMKPLGGLLHLVRDHGFREDTAKEMLKQASRQRKARFRVIYPDYLLKQAADPFLAGQGPTAPTFPTPPMGADSFFGGGGFQTQNVMSERVPVDGMQAQPGDREAYNPRTDRDRTPMDASAVQNAAGTGQREIVDTALIGQMLKVVRDDTMVDRFLGDLMRALDRLGRILFYFYWHNEKFADRYGKDEMPEMEDALRNAFEQLGDVIIFLKQKTIEPYPEEGMSVDLQDTAGVS